MRWPEPSHLSAFLVDQDRRVAAPGRLAERHNQVANLVGEAAIAPEKDEPGRIRIAKKTAFVRSQRFASTTQNYSTRRLRCRRVRLIGQ